MIAIIKESKMCLIKILPPKHDPLTASAYIVILFIRSVAHSYCENKAEVQRYAHIYD